MDQGIFPCVEPPSFHEQSNKFLLILEEMKVILSVLGKKRLVGAVWLTQNVY
jgi:hypothetical protein